MCEIGVLDTGVLIGFTIKNDQHHKTTRDYILNGDPETLYLPPRAKAEFNRVEQIIRNKIHREISSHRQDVIKEVNSATLSQNAIQFIRDGVLDENKQSRAHALLYRYYTDLYKQGGNISKSQIIRDLSNMETEVQIDRSKKYGGWRSHVTVWLKGTGTYPKLKSNLLLSDQPDLDILIEVHHIAQDQNSKRTEFATANPKDFIKKLLRRIARQGLISALSLTRSRRRNRETAVDPRDI